MEDIEMELDGKFEDTSALPSSFICEICGSANFSSQGGFYFCSVCNTQSQHTREYVQDEQQQIQLAHAVTRVGILGKTSNEKTKPKDQRVLLTSWEVYNLVLKAMTDKLIEIGFPALLKDKVFSLWRAYLVNRNVILCENDSNPVESRSSVSIGEPKINLRCLYNWKRKRNLKKRKTKPSVDSLRARRRAGGKLRRQAFEKTYLQTVGQSQEYQGLTTETQNIGITPLPPKLTAAAKLVCNKMKQNHQDFVLRSFSKLEGCVKNSFCHEMFQFKHVIILLFIACRQIGCRVLITDLVRLVYDGTLFVNSIKTLLGFEAVTTHSMESDVFLSSVLHFWKDPRSMSSMIQNTIDFLGVKRFQYPTFQEFLPKFIEDFCLPREFEGLILQINKKFDETEDLLELGEMTNRWKIYIEVMITSMIGLVLRMFFGLDDITEKHQSRFASKVNEIMSKHLTQDDRSDPRAEWTELFVIGDWFQFIRYRDDLLQQERYNPMMFSYGKPPNLTRANDVSSRYTTFGMDTPSVPETEPAGFENQCKTSKERLKKFSSAIRLKQIFQEATITYNGGPITEVPNYVCLPCPSQSVIEEFRRSKPNVSYPNYDTPLLASDFQKKRIDYIYNPAKYIPLLEKAGYKVKILPGIYSQRKTLLKTKRRTLLLFQPYKQFVESLDTTAPFSASMQVVIDCLSKYLYLQEYRRVKPIVLDIMERITTLYILRSSNGFVPLAS